MCGIFGFISEKQNDINSECFGKGIYALRQLQNRGYDSAGACCINTSNNDNPTNNLILRKYATTPKTDSIDRLEQEEKIFSDTTVGIFHTRWATHGAKTDLNSHPHVDHTNKIALVHNGIIENYYELKQELELNHGIIFKSETDTEVIANLISIYYEKLGHMEDAIENAVKKLRGTWALVIINSDKPDNIYCARHGSPLLIGFGDRSIMVASEQAGFGQSISNYICLNDHDITVIRRRNNKINFEYKDYELKELTIQSTELSPEPFDHWTLKEIHEQYESSIRAISFGGRIQSDEQVKLGGLIEHTSELKNVDHLILLGCGTSLNAAKHSVQYFRDLNNFITVQALDGSEFSFNDIPSNQSNRTAAIFLSQSGETKDLYRCLKICRNSNILITIGIINAVDSLIAREVDCGCYLNAGREVGVASTKAFTSQVILLSMVAIHFAQIHNINQKKRKGYIKSLRQLSQDIKQTILSTTDNAKDLANVLTNQKSMFVLGKGALIPVAEEIALKTKEIGYIHSEAYGGNALRHGPYALIEKDTPIVFINPTDSVLGTNNNESHFNLMNNTLEEVKSREAMTIMVTDADKLKLSDKIDHVISIQSNLHYQGILLNIPFQLVAYHMSISKGNNPDKPRHLSKCVSV